MRIAGTERTGERDGADVYDPSVSCVVGSNDDGKVTLKYTFEDASDRSLRARVHLEIDPVEAVDLVDKLISELGKLGVTLKIGGTA
jgi:hypothetical protein